MRCRIRVPTPHSDKQRQAFEAFITPGLSELWVACGTKWGKTLAVSAALAIAAPLRVQTLWRWIAPIYAQALIGMRYSRRILPPPPIITVRTSGSPPAIELPSIDTAIQYWHGQKPEDLEGEGVHGQGIDEGAKQKEQVYASAKTTTTLTRGPTAVFSTPRGKNWFYRGCMKAKLEMERAAFEGRPPKAIFLTAPSWDNPRITPEAIEEMRRSLPRRLFRQYVEAEFLDDGSVFEYLSDAFGNPLDYWHDDAWTLASHESRAIFIGADWAKSVDYTVMIALNDQGRLVGYRRFQRRPYPEQVASLFAFAAEMKRNSVLVGCHVVCGHDKTGVGEAVDDIIQATNPEGLDVHGVTWTNKIKETYVTDLILSFEEKALHLAPWQVLKDELAQFEANVGMSGRIIYAAPEGLHDDTVMALVIANRLFREGRGSISNVVVIDHLDQLIRRIQFQGGDLD